jgi:hypothetical protein
MYQCLNNHDKITNTEIKLRAQGCLANKLRLRVQLP